MPIEVRRRLGLREGDRVEFVIEDGRTVLWPARTKDNPFLPFLGALPAFKTREELLAWHRDLRDDDSQESDLPKEAGPKNVAQ